jgi:hypothetical protein
VTSVAENEKARQEKADELLRSGRLVFLQVSGYTPARIAGFGDLLKLTDEKVDELLQHQIDNAIARALGEKLLEQKRRVKKLRGRKRRK